MVNYSFILQETLVQPVPEGIAHISGCCYVFGELIHEYVNINLLLLLLITQAGYLGVLIYLDGYYESRCLSDEIL